MATSNSICYTVSSFQSGSSMLRRLMLVKTATPLWYCFAMFYVMALRVHPPRPLRLTFVPMLKELFSRMSRFRLAVSMRQWWLCTAMEGNFARLAGCSGTTRVLGGSQASKSMCISSRAGPVAFELPKGRRTAENGAYRRDVNSCEDGQGKQICG